MIKRAIQDVTAGHAQRICVPGKWRVWRDGDQVKHEIFQMAGKQADA
jgi:uncharacterized lipoprotein YmbA